MSDNKKVDNTPEEGQSDIPDTNIAVPPCDVSSIAGSVKTGKTPSRVSSSSERQIKFERAQKCLENAALVSKRIKEHRKATAELLGRPFEDDDGGDAASEMASTVSEITGYSVATNTSTTLSVQDALNIPGISESLANTLKQKEILMERIKQYKEISKRPITKPVTNIKREKADIKMAKNTSSNDDINQLQNTIKEKENALSVIQVKMKAMETTIIDLQEKNNEKDQIIEAKNLATTLMSDSLSKKEKDTLDLLEDTRQQMTKMQENFISMEAEWHNEKDKLLKEIEARDEKIINLEEANTILENSRFEISIAHSKLSEELEIKNKDILELQLKLEKIQREGFVEKEKKDTIEEKGVREIADMTELTRKVELLEHLNCQIRQTNKELENKLATSSESKSAASTSPIKKGSPLPTRKNVRNPGFKKSPWSNLSSESLPEVDKKSNKTEVAKLEMVIKSLNKDLLDKEYMISQKDVLISDLQITNAQNKELINNLQNASVTDKHANVDTVEIGTSTEVTSLDDSQLRSNDEIFNPETHSQDVKDLEEKLKVTENQVATLIEEIDAANKNMLKVKSAHKLKLKQMQKTIDNLSKISDANAEIVKLNEELHQLTQKVAELEEEKGNLQLHLVDYDSARLTDSEIYRKMLEMEHLAETRLKAISVLETQKFDLVQELHDQQQKNAELEDKLADMSHLQSEQVSSEMNSVQLEEQIDQLLGSKKELENMIESLKSDKEQLNSSISLLIDEKEEIHQKLETYIQENIELTDKLEKLSAEKVSSAESIEIVESLTTQEKLELEEYNKGIIENKANDRNIEDYKESESHECADNLEKLVQESAELNKKVELFTQERQEVMEKMNRISAENDALQEKILNLNIHCNTLQTNIEALNKEKQCLQTLNEELNTNIENLKRERIDIIQESVELIKPVNVEDPVETSTSETPVDDKLISEKGINRTKSVKQLTKEILKLKNTIKDREAEIADSQMKILSLEEQHQKHMELLQSNMSFENKIKNVVEENNQLKEVIENLRKAKETEDQVLKYNAELQNEVQRIHQEYSATINTRDHRIKELESILIDYERQMFNYANTLQEKDKEMAEYINQVTKLNDVSQKLRSTIELLEEEKAKDQNAELMKSLHKQISAYQKKLIECEEKIKVLEEEKVQILNLKNTLENKNASLDSELLILQDSITEKQNIIKELQKQQQKHTEEMSSIALQSKEREEEIHEIKLQLRKESIENEKLRTNLSEMTLNVENFKQEFDETKNKLNIAIAERDKLNEQNQELDNKNKELLEKLRKFAANLKKKSAKNVELEKQISDIKNKLSDKIQQTEQLSIQVDTITPLQEKIKYAEEEVNRLQLHRVTLEQQKCNDLQSLQAQLETASNEKLKLNETINSIQAELNLTRNENSSLILQIETLGKKLAEHEIEQKNNTNYITKINTLEADITQKNNKITELVETIENLQQQINQIHFGQDAKIQERDLFIETLETEVSKYKNRICRLEESISTMEDRRHSLERKADQLGSQLQEKQKAYTEYASQEDELVSRLAVLIDHDRVVEKQLYVIESENKELLYKIQHLSEENQRLRKSLSDIQEQNITLFDKASRTDKAEVEIDNYKSKLNELENNFKRISHEHQTSLAQKQRDIEELETEFNMQIENAIKEKKVLSEKYEKVAEHITQLENKLQEQKYNAESLNIHLNELTRVNHELSEKVADKGQSNTPDYTEQYVSEINKLNAVLNQRNGEIQELNNKLQHSHSKDLATIKNLESQVSDLRQELLETSNEVNEMAIQISTLKKDQEALQDQLSQKNLQIQQLMEKKTVSFEMNIPKTEGMIISSTIEALNEERKAADISSIESQILTELPASSSKKQVKQKKLHKDDVKRSELSEPIIVPKKAYLCYKGEEDAGEQEGDPFNSEEGWGLEGCEEVGDVTPGLFHLNKQILELKQQNEKLKTDLHASNTKLTKALKKLKELKNNNDMLANELKISKQISQTASLENAIEDELKSHIQELEKKIKELDASFNKEKREKEALQKQNEVFTNANEKLTEMKEKMDSELEFWKFKLKEANDKMSTLEWGADSPQHKITERNVTDTKLREEILKFDKENEELQLTVDRLTEENNQLSSQQVMLKGELNDIKQQLANQRNCENCSYLKTQLIQLQDENKELSGYIDSLKTQLSDFKNRCDTLETLNEELQIEFERQNKTLVQQDHHLKEELESLKQKESDNKFKIESLESELEVANLKVCALENNQIENKSQLQDTTELIQKCRILEDLNLELKEKLEKANSTISIIETEKEDLTRNYSEHNARVNELNEKIRNLNNENDNLLSTVTELRSSIASAVDQRGFEIAELWKQHLAQREADFQKTELELRDQINQWESKYETIIDTIQSNTLEQTNKEIYSEHLNTLQKKLIEKEEHLKNLQEKYAEVMNQMDNLRSENEDEKLMHENKLLEQQEEYEKQIQELSLSKQQHAEEYESLYKNVNSELAASKTINDELSQQVKDLTSAVEKAEAKVTELTNELRAKDSEIYQKTHDYTMTLSQRNEEFEIIRKQLLEYEKKIEDLSYEKEADLAVLRLKMHEKNEKSQITQKEFEIEKAKLIEVYNAKVIECTNLNKQIADLNKVLEEHSNKTIEMQTALETQELEIVTLKDNILSLQDMLRQSSSKVAKHVTFATDTKSVLDVENVKDNLNKELLDAVPRAELDLALYMLHQRDVRCEELTMELTQLLEERDTLQLRLSDSLRSYEEMKSKSEISSTDVSKQFSGPSEKSQPFVDIHRAQSSRSSSVSDPEGDKPKLQAKLSELRSVRHSRDVVLRHDSEQRQLDMRLLQRDVAHLPQEAVDQLAQAHHTLSRDTQSTPTVLLNWLRGKSTPKVVHM